MNDVASLLLWSLGRTTLWLAAATLVTAFVLRIARPTWPAAHRLAWLVVLLVGWSFIRLPVAVPWYEAQQPEPTAIVEIAPSELLVDRELPVVAIAPITAEPSDEIVSTTPVASASAPIAQPPVATKKIDWPVVLLGTWALGAAALVAAWGVGYLLFARSLRARVPVGEVHQAEWRELLAAAGVWREIPLSMTESFGPLLCRLPRGFEIIVPESLWRELNARERTAILRHELAHYLRGDIWTSLVARVLALPHWFNPAAWWAARQFDEAAEWACDRAAAGDDATTDYANALVRLGQVSPQATFYGTAARGRSLASRIRRVLAGPSRQDSLMKKASLVAITLGLVAASVVQIELVAQQPVGEEKKPAEENRGAEEAADDKPADEAEEVKPAEGQASPTGPTAAPYLRLLQSKAATTDDATDQDKSKSTVYQAAVKKVERMASEARAAYKANLAAFEAETVTMDSVYDWSLRWMRAEQFPAPNDKLNVAAIRAHLVRMLDLQRKIAALYKLNTRGGEEKELRAVNFYVAEAERWLHAVEALADSGGNSSSSAPAAEATRVVDLKITISEIEQEISKAEIDVSLAEELLATANAAEERNPGAISKSETRRLLADYQKSKLQLEYLRKRLALHRDKLKLLSSEPENQPVLRESAVSKPTKSDPINRDPTVAGKSVRYEGKDFESWAEELRNDLSPERRAEAIRALAAFGAYGYGPQAAELIIKAALPKWINARDRSVSKLGVAARAAFLEIPAKDTLPLLVNSLKSETTDERMFALFVLPDTPRTRNETAQLLIPMLKDPAAEVRQSAASQLIHRESSSPELVALLREWLASDDSDQVSLAAQTIAGFVASEAKSSPKSSPYMKMLDELLPDLLRAMERPEPYGPRVEQWLVSRLTSNALTHLFETIKSTKTELGPRSLRFFETRLGKKLETK